MRQDEKYIAIFIARVDKEKCDLAQKLDITTFISNTAGIVQFNVLWVFDLVVSIMLGKHDSRINLYYLVLCGLDDLVM